MFILVAIIPKITDYLLPTEKILWQKLPEPKASSKARVEKVPILTGAILVILFSLLFIHSALSRTTQTTILTFYFVLIAVGLILIGIGIAPVISYNKAKDTEYIITNQRVLIGSSKNSKDPRIINLYEVNGQIKMKYNESRGIGSIWIPTPHWNRFVTPEHISPDIKNVKDPFTVHSILIEAIEIGKRTKWK